MKYPPKRDRIVNYTAMWVSCSGKIHSLRLVLLHDCVTKKAQLAVAKVQISVTHVNELEAILTDCNRQLKSLGLNIPDIPKFPFGLVFQDQNIVVLEGTDLKLGSPPEVICFLNQVASIFGLTAVLALERHIIQREVFVRFMSDKKRWVDEAKWLCQSAVFDYMEVRIFHAILNLRKEGDAVHLTLGRSIDPNGAKLLIQGHGISYILAGKDMNRLVRVCEERQVLEDTKVTLYYRTLITAGARQFAKSLARYTSDVAFASCA